MKMNVKWISHRGESIDAPENSIPAFKLSLERQTDGMECDDGFIYIVYDRERGAFRNNLEEIYGDAREILTARFTEEDIIAGALVTEGSWLKKVICKLGRLADDMPDPFTL